MKTDMPSVTSSC